MPLFCQSTIGCLFVLLTSCWVDYRLASIELIKTNSTMLLSNQFKLQQPTTLKVIDDRARRSTTHQWTGNDRYYQKANKKRGRNRVDQPDQFTVFQPHPICSDFVNSRQHQGIQRNRHNTNPFENPSSSSSSTRLDDSWKSFQFTTPNYPNLFPPNVDCIKIIVAPTKNHRISLNFRGIFELEPSDICNHDFVEVRDGAFGFSPILGRFCSKGLPDLGTGIRSTGPYMWLRFRSDGEIQHLGFQAVYHFFERKKSRSPDPVFYIHKLIQLDHDALFLLNDTFLKKQLGGTKYEGQPLEAVFDLRSPKDSVISLYFNSFKVPQAFAYSCDPSQLQSIIPSKDCERKIREYYGTRGNRHRSDAFDANKLEKVQLHDPSSIVDGRLTFIEVFRERTISRFSVTCPRVLAFCNHVVEEDESQEFKEVYEQELVARMVVRIVVASSIGKSSRKDRVGRSSNSDKLPRSLDQTIKRRYRRRPSVENLQKAVPEFSLHVAVVRKKSEGDCNYGWIDCKGKYCIEKSLLCNNKKKIYQCKDSETSCALEDNSDSSTTIDSGHSQGETSSHDKEAAQKLHVIILTSLGLSLALILTTCVGLAIRRRRRARRAIVPTKASDRIIEVQPPPSPGFKPTIPSTTTQQSLVKLTSLPSSNHLQAVDSDRSKIDQWPKANGGMNPRSTAPFDFDRRNNRQPISSQSIDHEWVDSIDAIDQPLLSPHHRQSKGSNYTANRRLGDSHVLVHSCSLDHPASDQRYRPQPTLGIKDRPRLVGQSSFSPRLGSSPASSASVGRHQGASNVTTAIHFTKVGPGSSIGPTTHRIESYPLKPTPSSIHSMSKVHDVDSSSPRQGSELWVSGPSPLSNKSYNPTPQHTTTVPSHLSREPTTWFDYGTSHMEGCQIARTQSWGGGLLMMTETDDRDPNRHETSRQTTRNDRFAFNQPPLPTCQSMPDVNGSMIIDGRRPTQSIARSRIAYTPLARVSQVGAGSGHSSATLIGRSEHKPPRAKRPRIIPVGGVADQCWVPTAQEPRNLSPAVVANNETEDDLSQGSAIMDYYEEEDDLSRPHSHSYTTPQMTSRGLVQISPLHNTSSVQPTGWMPQLGSVPRDSIHRSTALGRSTHDNDTYSATESDYSPESSSNEALLPGDKRDDLADANQGRQRVAFYSGATSSDLDTFASSEEEPERPSLRGSPLFTNHVRSTVIVPNTATPRNNTTSQPSSGTVIYEYEA